MFNLSISNSHVSVDGASGRPRAIRSNGEQIVLTSLDAVRDETAAYPLETGPRTVFIVRAQERRYRLVHLLRDGSWTVEELAPPTVGLADAA